MLAPPPVQPARIANDPDSILQKLNDKNNEFISAYNASALEKRAQEPKPKPAVSSPVVPQVVELKPESNSPSAANKGGARDETFKTTVRCRTFANKSKLDGEY